MFIKRFIFLLLCIASPFGRQGVALEISHIGMASPNRIEIVFQNGGVETGRQIPYVKQNGDEVRQDHQNAWLYREGRRIGALVGKNADVFMPFDQFVGEHFDISPMTDPQNVAIHSADDDHYQTPQHPKAIHRKSKPINIARIDSWQFDAPVEHHLFLQLPHSLQTDALYDIQFANADLEPVEFVYQPQKMRSESVHVSQIGFRPSDPVKTAFLSCWMGSGGGLDFGSRISFSLIDNEAGAIVYSSTATLSKSAKVQDEDAYKNNFNLTNVYELDFSAVSAPGDYRVYVKNIGCSYPFPISENAWRSAFITSARGFYHQRSGVALQEPFTDFIRPRPFHPGDGMKIYASTTRLMDSRNGLSDQDPDNFRNLVAGKTDEEVAGAWGGLMDAGDWDRRIQHLRVSVLLLELAEMHPDYFSSLSLNIPESGNALPDIVDEALFNLDFYRRLQTPEGGVRGGVESEEHPKFGECSWQESLTVMAYAPGVWSSYGYAGTAARAAFVLEALKTLQPETEAQEFASLADLYRQSALRAMQWAETQYQSTDWNNLKPQIRNGMEIRPMDDNHAVRDARNFAAAELFRLTGDESWSRLFADTTRLNDPKAELSVWEDHNQSDAAWVYARTDQPGADPQLKEYCKNAIIKEAEDRIRTQQKTGFRWTKNDWAPPATSMSSPDAVSLVRAHALTGQVKYLQAAVLACQAGAGANPLNLCYTTRLGHRWPQNPLHLDSRQTGQMPPEGLTIFGPVNPKERTDYFGQKIAQPFLYPPAEEWPIMESYWDIFWNPIMCEFTVHRPMAANAYVWGYLAARK
ncbi:MAG: glycoside hydrolase family 9 protein [Candidatus Omnitrophica bacterium]|nr:glycoside hydrolase family 9 protein [Candidatus Omnitrophota bacterium]